MNKKAWILVIIIFLILMGVVYMSGGKGDIEIPEQNIADVSDTETAETQDTTTTGDAVSAGSYEPYSPEKLALADTGKVVLFFRASWCPTCRGLDSDIKSNLNKIPEGVVILDVDYDNSTALRQKYGVTYQHTLVQVDASGNQITKWASSPTLSDILARIR